MEKQQMMEAKNTRKLRRDPALRAKMKGVFEQAVQFLERNQISEVSLWKEFVEQFRLKWDDADRRWRCEYWGKMMRGAAMILRYTGGEPHYTQSYANSPDFLLKPTPYADDRMYRILEDSVRDLLTTEDADGRIATYDANEFSGWDMWGRKYVLLGMQYFLEICRDESLAREMIASMCRQVDYIIAHIGAEEGKIGICQTSNFWFGMNSCSILEPIVRLYRLTGEKRYFDFATYIVSTGFCSEGNLIDLAFEGEIAPYQYPVTKAYEMMSCFEGLLQYYDLTGEERYKTALLNFGKKILETEISVIGCSGCTHELFDHTAVRQTDTDYTGVMQETCVAVTWIKFATALLELSGDTAYADAIEQTFLNCYLGAMNTHRILHVHKPDRDVPVFLPFASYSPLTAGERARYIGGCCTLSDRTFYGCCACIGAAGAGAIPQMALMRREDGFFFGFYAPGEYRTQTPEGNAIVMTMETQYPKDGNLKLTVSPDVAETFAISFRIPAWCEKAVMRVNGEAVDVTPRETVVTRSWAHGDVVELDFAMPVVRILPPEGAIGEERYAAYRRGPVVLAADRRVTDPDAVIAVRCEGDRVVEATEAMCPEIPDCMECYEVVCEDGSRVRLIDYASAGKTWAADSRCAAWLRRI